MSDRLEAVSRHMSFLLRHAPTKPSYEGELIFDPEGFVGLDLLRDVRPRVRKLQITKSDIEEICRAPASAGKFRFQRKAGQGGNVLIRAFQGHSFGPIRDDQSLKFLDSPGPLFHATTQGALRSILREGLQVVERSAIHFVSHPLDARKALYLTSRKSPFILTIDCDRATTEGQRTFPEALNGVVLSDGDTP